MKLRFIILSLFLCTLASCEEDEPETNCYNCTRLIQTLNKDAILILTQEDQYELCNKTKEEITQFELDNRKDVTTSSGGKQEFFTNCFLIE
ncbi:hypothetical protein N7E81_16790 [Reichenbachiella carrageenanivorans]|uniref:Lipoprotein n=1 Tax=Reichenbachiella carrageenanivorans TaxID=2979869 RepID=A0ABY6CYR8_9BACT|nr:hypothetical protein [Reichenbachiella carrageenanivorans]UXX79013.1 hypothetical protein N7E81_16790 [Reichenbachiella carrageenanivorans]